MECRSQFYALKISKVDKLPLSKCNFQRTKNMTLIEIYSDHVSKMY